MAPSDSYRVWCDGGFRAECHLGWWWSEKASENPPTSKHLLPYNEPIGRPRDGPGKPQIPAAPGETGHHWGLASRIPVTTQAVVAAATVAMAAIQ